jgi:hypothetical protein
MCQAQTTWMCVVSRDCGMLRQCPGSPQPLAAPHVPPSPFRVGIGCWHVDTACGDQATGCLCMRVHVDAMYMCLRYCWLTLGVPDLLPQSARHWNVWCCVCNEVVTLRHLSHPGPRKVSPSGTKGTVRCVVQYACAANACTGSCSC